jgi:hypothetical protein
MNFGSSMNIYYKMLGPITKISFNGLTLVHIICTIHNLFMLDRGLDTLPSTVTYA